MAAAAKTTWVVPGQRLQREDSTHVGGNGTYTKLGYIYSSLVGYVCIRKEKDDTFLVEVRRGTEQQVLPTPASIVTVRITSINPRYCKCEIVCIQDVVLREPFRGMIRKEDVRQTEVDKVEMNKCFRPGDIVLGRIISLGDAHSYLISTAEDELGVVIAHSEAGSPMVAVNHNEMQCPKTYTRESRKVAMIVSENTGVPTSINKSTS